MRQTDMKIKALAGLLLAMSCGLGAAQSIADLRNDAATPGDVTTCTFDSSGCASAAGAAAIWQAASPNSAIRAASARITASAAQAGCRCSVTRADNGS